MHTNRIIEEKYWSEFIRTDAKTNKEIRNGQKFEELIKELLNLMYDNLKWEPTQITHDGNKDFKAQNEEDIYWAECKNYKTKIDLKTLAATLVMAEIENVNSILFFCYSEINKNTKTKLNSFSKSTQKIIYFFDGIVLDQLILKYKEKILPKFFPDLYKQLNNRKFSSILTEPTVLCYLERNPFFNGIPSFDLNKLLELQDLKMDEIIGIHLFIINTNMEELLKYSIKLLFLEHKSFFEVLVGDEAVKKECEIVYNPIELLPGETGRKDIYLKLKKSAPMVSLPKIICQNGQKEIGMFLFPQIRTLKTKQTAFVGTDYLAERDYLCKNCLNKNTLSIMYIYGNSGTGKSRMLYECTDRFVAEGYQIIRFSGMYKVEHSTYAILQELIFALYGFTNEIIDHIIQNNYEDLENYNTPAYKAIFRVIKEIHSNRYTLSKIKDIEYIPIFEKMVKGKYLLAIDDIQYWEDDSVAFLKSFFQYALNMQRNCNAVIAIVANTDVLYNQRTIEFLAELESCSNDYRKNICKQKVNGFKTKDQSFLFLKEILGINEDFSEIEEVTNFSHKPKYITEVANYLQDVKAVDIIADKAVILDKNFFRMSLNKLPENLNKIIEERWILYLKNFEKEQSYYKNVICSILFLGKVNLQYDKVGVLHKNAIDNLCQYGFLKELDSHDNTYTFEHDSIKFYFQTYYIDWFETAIRYLGHCKEKLVQAYSLELICNMYANGNITAKDYYNYKKFSYSTEIKYKMNEWLLTLILRNGSNGLQGATSGIKKQVV